MGLTDYSNLEQEIKDAPEPKILTAGTEVKARIKIKMTAHGISQSLMYLKILW